MIDNLKQIFSLFILIFCHLRIGALEYPMIPGSTLNDHKSTTSISTELLDAFVEKQLSSLCIIKNEQPAHLSDKLKQWLYDGNNGGGTGFFITPEGHLLTNKHVVEDRSKLIVFLGHTGHFVNASIIATHPVEDLALLKIEKPHNMNLPYLRLSSIREEVGDWVFSLRGRGIIEYNSHLFALPSIGKVIGYIENSSFAVLSMAVSVGNSGSPVLNLEGNVIGILTIKPSVSGLNEDPGISGALVVHKVKSWIEEILRSDGYFEKLE